MNGGVPAGPGSSQKTTDGKPPSRAVAAAPRPAAGIQPAPRPVGDAYALVGGNGAHLPADLIAVPLWDAQADAPIKLCVICRKTADPVQGHLLLRRDLLDAKVYLGCMADAVGPLELVDVWVQSTDGLADAARASVLTGHAVNNQVLDERWRKLFEVSLGGWPGALIACGFERVNPPPTFVDLESKAPVNPKGWSLCTDDAALRAAQLPPYSGTLYRYLARGTGPEARFIPLSADCPRNGNTLEFDAVLDGYARLVPVNPGAGLVLIKPAGNMRLSDLKDVFGGRAYDGSAYGKSRLRFGPVQALAAPSRGLMFPEDPRSSAAAFVEAYLLKVTLFAGMIEEVARFTAATQRPLLNLQPASFAARLDDVGAQLPALWTARPLLVDAGDAIPVAFPQGETSYNYCLPGKSVRASIYQPALVARGSVRGFGQLFLSGSTKQPGGAVFDGTLTLVDMIRPTRRDVFRLRVPVANGKRVDLYVRVDPAASPAAAVLKFRSVPDPRTVAADEAAVENLVGVPLQEVEFEFYPLLGSACDVYSLAVLGVDLLLTRAGGNNAEQFSELRNLATRCRETYSDRPLEGRLEAIFAERPEWARKLGPQSIISDDIDPAKALQLITPELWWATLALLIRMLPGLGPDSYLTDFGDSVRERIEGIYQQLTRDAGDLVRRARMLLFGEWGVNRQIGAILEELRAPARPQAGPAGSPPPRAQPHAAAAPQQPQPPPPPPQPPQSAPAGRRGGEDKRAARPFA